MRQERGGPVVPIVIELGPAMGEMAALVGSSLPSGEADLRVRMERLGIPGRPDTRVTKGDSARAVRIRVHDALQPYAPQTLWRTWCAVAPERPGGTAAPAAVAPWTGFPDRWLVEALTGPGRADAERAALAEAFLATLLVDVVSQHPGCLVSAVEAAAYGRRAGNAAVPPPPVDDLMVILRSLLELGVSVRNRGVVLEAITEGRARGVPIADVVEGAFSRLRTAHVVVSVNPGDFKHLVAASEAQSVPVQDERVGDQTRAEFAAMQERLQLGWGLRLPELRLAASGDVPAGEVSIVVNDHATPPIPLDDGSVAWTAHTAILGQAPRLLGIDDVELALAELERAFPALITACLGRISLGDLTRVLRGLLHEHVPIRDLLALLERLVQYDAIPADATEKIVRDERLPVGERRQHEWPEAWRNLLAFVRGGKGLQNYFSSYFRRGSDNLVRVTRLDADLERRALALVGASGTDAQREALRDALWERLPEVPATAPVIAMSPAGRAALRAVLEDELPGLAVLAECELRPGTRVRPAEAVSAG